MRYLLFKYTNHNTYLGTIDNGLSIKQFNPRPFRFYAGWEKHKDMATTIFRLYISILTLCKASLLCVVDEYGNIRHSAYVIPHNIKYDFLNKGEYSIGPCNTPEEFIGQGLYPYMLSYITNKNPNANYYVFIREENKASIRGATKAGFTQCKESIIDSKFLRIFKLQKENTDE